MYKLVKKGAFVSFLKSISQKTINVLNILLLPLTVAFIYIGFEFWRAASFDIIAAKDYFFPIFEHLMVSLVIIICGSALLDLSLREVGDNDA